MGESFNVDGAFEAETIETKLIDDSSNADDAGPGGGAGGGGGFVAGDGDGRGGPRGEGGFGVVEGGFEQEESIGVGEVGGEGLVEEKEENEKANSCHPCMGSRGEDAGWYVRANSFLLFFFLEGLFDLVKENERVIRSGALF